MDENLQKLKIGLFIPCYVNEFFPRVGIATLTLLERLGLQIYYPDRQTCCGQPMGNNGCVEDARGAAEHFVSIFKSFDYIVAPSGSCVSYVRNHYTFLKQTSDVLHVRNKTYELCEFLTDVVKPLSLASRFPHRVGIHNCCHGHRGLGLASPSEKPGPSWSKLETLLKMVAGVELVTPKLRDECCGFGGMFCISEEAVSVRMGLSRLEDHERAGAEVLTGVDASCLMHLEGLAKRHNKEIRLLHLAEILAGEL